MDLQLPEADVPEPSLSAAAPATPEPASQPEIATTQADSRQQPESAQVEAPQPEPPAAAKPPRSDAPAPGWYAQLGSFGQQANAAALRDTLGKAGFAVQLQMVDTGKGTSYRVLAGPEPDRASAESLLRKLGDRMKTTGIVIEIGAAGG
jgi:general secretion pathway protein D